ncbi:glycosyltransferase [Shewanella glacialipiscicola]|uniref:glycosyltransferase n=1 Tax=Shewanella glacialipiscicola TaxID=614069 RepID=UPI003D7AF9DC
MKFSVLMSLYHKERSSFLNECLQSIEAQSISPTEIVIVEDGCLTKSLYDTLDFWEARLPIVRVHLSENLGLGKALNEGIKYCKTDFVARMDTDDICDPLRFEKQLSKIVSVDADVCGSWVSEFETNKEFISAYRKPPETHEEIVATSKFKNPLNHPSVMYRKSAVIDVGGYDDILFFEDYHLWLKLINQGYKFYNIQEPLVSMRAGLGQLSRRGGFAYACLELSFLKKSSREGIMQKRHALRNAVIRFPIRVLPTQMLGKIYKIIRSRDV